MITIRISILGFLMCLCVNTQSKAQCDDVSYVVTRLESTNAGIALRTQEIANQCSYGSLGQVVKHNPRVIDKAMTDFTAYVDVKKAVALSWTAELHEGGFEVLHSANGTEWDLIDYVETNTLAINTTKYSFSDSKPFTGNNYYRLNQIDNKGNKTSSKITKVHLSSATEIQLHPNIAHEKLTVVYENFDQVASLKILDVEGKMMLERQVFETTTIALDRLASGMYLVQLQIGKDISKQTVMKL